MTRIECSCTWGERGANLDDPDCPVHALPWPPELAGAALNMVADGVVEASLLDTAVPSWSQ